jgi:hypothetical protein
MTGTTPVEGYPYPLEADFADVQDAFRLATAIDADLRSEQAPFRTFLARPSFIGRQTSTGSGFTTGSASLIMGAVDWDNTGGLIAGSTVWNQPLAQAPSWWMFGATILVSNLAAAVVGDMTMGQIQASSVDQVTGVQSVSNFYQRNDDSNTAGEWINFFAMAAIYQGQADCLLNLNGTTSKAIANGSRFWGMYLGPVT